MIEKIPNFKTWVVGCFKGGLETWVGHIDMHLLKVFVDLSSWPIMQYKVSPIDSVWSLTNGPMITLWNCNLNGSPKLPIGVPSFVPYNPIWVNDALRSMEKE